MARTTFLSKLTDEQKFEFIDLFNLGSSYTEIGKHFNVNSDTVGRTIKELGLTRKLKNNRLLSKTSAPSRDNLLHYMASHFSVYLKSTYNTIAKHYNTDIDTVMKWISTYNILDEEIYVLHKKYVYVGLIHEGTLAIGQGNCNWMFKEGEIQEWLRDGKWFKQEKLIPIKGNQFDQKEFNKFMEKECGPDWDKNINFNK